MISSMAAFQRLTLFWAIKKALQVIVLFTTHKLYNLKDNFTTYIIS